MKRLTGRRDGHAYIIGCPDFALPKIIGLIIQQTVDRLAAIEDILGDEYELNDLEKALWCKKVVADAFSDNPEATERLRELWFADKDGRCVVFSPGYPVVSTYHKDESGRVIREVAGAVPAEEYEAALKAREQDD